MRPAWIGEEDRTGYGGKTRLDMKGRPDRLWKKDRLGYERKTEPAMDVRPACIGKEDQTGYGRKTGSDRIGRLDRLWKEDRLGYGFLILVCTTTSKYGGVSRTVHPHLLWSGLIVMIQVVNIRSYRSRIAHIIVMYNMNTPSYVYNRERNILPQGISS